MPRIPVDQLKLNMTLKKQVMFIPAARQERHTPPHGQPHACGVTLAPTRSGSLPGVFFDDAQYVPDDTLVLARRVEVTGRIGEFKRRLLRVKHRAH
jgi:hypothetical protein